MKIKDSDISIRSIAGKDEEGRPIVYIQTNGGLHAVFRKTKNDEIESLAAAPHIAIMKWLAEKKEPSIKWNDDFEKNNDLQKAEEDLFKRVRKIVFAPKLESPISNPENLYAVYNYESSTIEIFQKSDLASALVNYPDSTILRDLSLADLPKTKRDFMQEGE